MSAETTDHRCLPKYPHIHMAPLAEFDVRPSAATRQWMAAKARRERIPVKATTQAWFKGMFREADDAQ